MIYRNVFKLIPKYISNSSPNTYTSRAIRVFSIKRLKVSAAVKKDVSDEIVRRVLRGVGCRFLHSRKKGLLEKDDLKKRQKFARKITKMLTNKFWEEGISFYVDAAGFRHKCNPHDEVRSLRTMVWRLKNEGLHPHCTAKGSNVGSGGRVARFIVAITHQKGVILCEQY